MSEAVETIEGWYALHDFRTIAWDRWRTWPESARTEAVAGLTEAMRNWDAVQANGQGSFGLYQVIGHKADLLFLNLRPDSQQLADVKWDLNRLAIGDILQPATSYYSVVELSKYLAQGEANPENNPGLRARLFPILPRTQYVCFYPMNKKREGIDNWYMMDREQRRQLMRSHGMIGHKYHGAVTQIITGSQGLDDWEWGVTLYAEDPLQFKKLIYEMRFDEASARFAEFGPFLVGIRREISELSYLLQL
ncbi:MAG: heme-dependent peroxidase [Sulfobacillus benefaciens]|uniref:Coproheme decarboxylase n=1 Tax=Sulfobacillus benefaciens TaxID=453960 RepID=A0A2T2XG54_9FIRM|nr:MAG: heme-dependent peroxidase [Sulfobacillus benefaciens]